MLHAYRLTGSCFLEPHYTTQFSILMMNKISSLFVAAMLSVLALSAQKSKMTTGIMALNNGDPVTAIQKIEESFERIDDIKAKHQPKGYYNLAKAYLQVSSDSNADIKGMFPDALLKAKENYQIAMNHPESRRIENTAKTEQMDRQVFGALFNRAVTDFNEGAYEAAREYFKAAQDMRPDHFMTNRLLGNASLLTGDTTASINYLVRAVDIYENRYLNTEGDSEKEKSIEVYKATGEYQQDSAQMPDVFRLLAGLYATQQEYRKALDLIESSEEVIGKNRDLKLQELDIYNKNPDLLDEAKAKFEAAIAEDPDDLPIKLAYASLLERNDENDKALELYREAYEQDPDNLQANYGLGAYYINEAAELSQQKAEMKKEAEIQKMDERIKDFLEKAYPYMKKLHELQPNEREWLSQLVTITGNLGMEEEMNAYGEKLGEMNN